MNHIPLEHPNTIRTIAYLERHFPVHSRLCGLSYLSYFLIGKLSYSPVANLAAQSFCSM